MRTVLARNLLSNKLHYNHFSMSRFNFFKGLLWGLCLSACMWWGIYQTVDSFFSNQDIVTSETQNDVEQDALVFEEKNP